MNNSTESNNERSEMTGQMRVMDKIHGDFTIRWNKDDDESVENARKTFDELMSGEHGRVNFNAYKVSGKGRRTGTPIKEFDPTAAELLVVPQMAGG